MKTTEQCKHKRKGGWCGRYYTEEYHLTQKGLEKRHVSQRCKDVTRCPLKKG